MARALPQAVQVADRWHLMENASRAFLDAVRKSMRQIRGAIGATVVNPALLTAAEKLQYDGYLRREEANAAVLALWQEGVPIKQIVRRTGHRRPASGLFGLAHLVVPVFVVAGNEDGRLRAQDGMGCEVCHGQGDGPGQVARADGDVILGPPPPQRPARVQLEVEVREDEDPQPITADAALICRRWFLSASAIVTARPMPPATIWR